MCIRDSTYAEEDTPSQIPEDQIQVSLSELQDRISSRYLELPTANGEEWSVYIQELSSGAVCSISADRKMQSASVIKLFIMSAIYEPVSYTHLDVYKRQKRGFLFLRLKQSGYTGECDHDPF